MCLPPNVDENDKYFFEMKKLAAQIHVKELSMGMSSDYIQAAENGATFLRIGSNIFGSRVK